MVNRPLYKVVASLLSQEAAEDFLQFSAQFNYWNKYIGVIANWHNILWSCACLKGTLAPIIGISLVVITRWFCSQFSIHLFYLFISIGLYLFKIRGHITFQPSSFIHNKLVAYSNAAERKREKEEGPWHSLFGHLHTYLRHRLIERFGTKNRYK